MQTLNLRTTERHFGPRPAPVAFSLAAHAVVLGWVAVAADQDRSPQDRPYSVYRQLIQPNEKKLVWYHFPKKLPEVSPPEPVKSRTPIRAEIKHTGQTIIARPPRAPRANLMVWQPLPKLNIQQDVQLPNLLAFKAPPPPPPPAQPKPKPFTPPTQPRRAVQSAPALPNAPKLELALDTRKMVPRADLPDPLLIKPKLKDFVPPPETPRPKLSVPSLPAAPKMDATISANVPVIGRDDVRAALAIKYQPKQFVPPSTGSGAGRKPAPALGDAPAISAPGANSQLSAAIVGLQPADKLTAPLPNGSRPAQFSVGPETGATSGGAGAGRTSAIVVPDLLIRDSAKDAKPTLMARATLAPTSSENLVETAKGMIRTPSPPRLKATRVSSAPDPMMHGREIYIVAIQMPNVTSYTGSWIMWFAERGKTPGEMADVRPPIPVKKVDPKYYPSAIADRVEGKVQLSAVISRDGHVYSVNLLKRLDDRLDHSAEEALRKWEFQPALRNGQPVDVDAVVEIPFRLAPPISR